MAAEAGQAGPFVGRREAVEALIGRLDEVRANLGGATLLVGEPGVGKSALVTLLIDQVREKGFPVLVGRAPPLDDPPPFSLLRSAVESALPARTPSGSETPPVPPATLPVLETHPGAQPLADVVSMEERLLDALGGDASRGAAERERVLENLARQFEEITLQSPLVLVLEDVYRSDDSSLAAVEFLAGRLHHRPFWMLATTRPARTLSDAGRERLERFERASRARTVTLPPLTREETAEFLHLLRPAEELSPDEVARRHAESDGIPLRLIQGVRLPAAGGPSPRERPPLGPEPERVLGVAAVLGPEFARDTLLRVAGGQDGLSGVVDQLVANSFLEERPGGRLAFPEDRTRDEVYRHLTDHQREILHWSAGMTLEAKDRGGVANVYALARHFYLGRAGGKAVRYNRLAAEIADRALAPEVARDHLLKAVESQRDIQPADIEVESELVLELARVTEELGRLAEAEKELKEFLDREKDDARLSSRRRGSLEIFLSRVLTDRGNLPAAVELAQKVLDSPVLAQQPVLGVGAHHQLGMALYYEGQYARALAHHSEELRLAREVGNPFVVLRAQIWRVAALAMMGPTDEAVAEARAITFERDRLNSARESAQAHLFLGDMLADARCTPAQRKEALDEYARAMEFAEKAHDPRRLGWARYKTGELLCEARRYDEATRSADQAVTIFREMGDSVGLSMATKVLGQVLLAQRKYDQAERSLDEAYRLLRGLHHTLEEIDVVLRLGQLEYAQGDLPNAHRHLVELERLRLPALRPDLADEMTRLKQALDTSRGDGASS